MANGVFSEIIDAKPISERVDGKHCITGVELFVPFNYPSGKSTAGTHYNISLADAESLLAEIQSALNKASEFNQHPNFKVQSKR